MTTQSAARPLGTPSEVAEYLGIPEQTLAQWRWRSRGPRFSRVGRHVRYRWADVERWLDQQAGEMREDAARVRAARA